jgi:hypothetical protein
MRTLATALLFAFAGGCAPDFDVLREAGDAGMDAAVPPEIDCDNGADDDGDGQADCTDPDCDRQSCAGPMQHCCAGSCTSVRSNERCGSCAAACAEGQSCVEIGGSAQCSCDHAAGGSCPLLNICGTELCLCGSDHACDPGGRCEDGICLYF